MQRRIALGTLLATAWILLAAPAAHAEGPLKKVVPAGGGLEAFDVSIDATSGVVRVVRGGRSKDLAIPIDRARIDAAASTIDIVPVGEGRSVARVRVPDAQRKDLAFEAVL